MLRIQEICKEKGVTMQQLAARLGVTYQALYASIGGNPTLSKLQDIAAALRVSVTDLFDRPTDGKATGACPHCGKPVKIKLEE